MTLVSPNTQSFVLPVKVGVEVAKRVALGEPVAVLNFCILAHGLKYLQSCLD